MAFTIFTALATVLFAVIHVNAESHTVQFDNQCGYGTPTLIVGGQAVSTGQDYTSQGPLAGGIAYLQTGKCGYNGESCTLLEMTLGNPAAPGSGSSTDISLIPPHAFSVTTSFNYYGGCDNTPVTTCNNPQCNTAFFQPNDNQVQVQCEADNVNLLITFCGSGSGSPAPSSTSEPSSTETPSSTKAAAPSSTSVPVESSSVSVEQPSPTSSSVPAATPPGSTRKSCARRRSLKNRTSSDLAERIYAAEADLLVRYPDPAALRAHRKRGTH